MSNCPNMLNKIAGWKTDAKGLTGCMRSTGRAKEKAIEATDINMPLAIICASDGRVPSTVIVDIVYAEIMDSSIIISICCTAESSVQRPCLMMSTHALIEGVRVVKGAAVEASPSWTMGNSSAIMASRSPAAFLAAPAAKALPCFFCMSACSFWISSFILPTTDFIADICAITPTSSPRSRRAWSSSSIHCCCFDMRSRFFRSISSLAFFDMAWARSAFSLRCSASASSASLISSGFASCPSPPPTFAFPKPLSKAKPTSASFRAPTSLPPSPHIIVKAFLSFRTALMICSFWNGESRAKT
mmetsp:Transcript_33413/g.95896  ORF Transcript_33413/g.95896 Transcript_33413/m.95896 type:complete len:301 (-) Transcript_33413:2905-3807(-)